MTRVVFRPPPLQGSPQDVCGMCLYLDAIMKDTESIESLKTTKLMLRTWNGDSRANRQQFLTCKRSRCEESFLACCSQPLVDVHETFLHSLQWGDNWFCSRVTTTAFDFTPHGPCSCLTVQQLNQSIAFSRRCRGAHLFPPGSGLWGEMPLPTAPAACACCVHGAAQPQQLRRGEPTLCSKGQRGHAVDTVPWTPQLWHWPTHCLLQCASPSLLREPCAYQRIEKHPSFCFSSDLSLHSHHHVLMPASGFPAYDRFKCA